VPGLQEARAAIEKLDLSDKWSELATKDLPVSITSYVSSALKSMPYDEVKERLGMRATTDLRWRKIMMAIRSGFKVDSAAIFAGYFERSNRFLSSLDRHLEEVASGNRPYTKQTYEGIRLAMEIPQSVVRLGKDLGVFTDGSDQRQGGNQGVTIIVNTNVPIPSKEIIIQHQQDRERLAKELLDKHRPKELGKPEEKEDSEK
jgi:hypothetical protein